MSNKKFKFIYYKKKLKFDFMYFRLNSKKFSTSLLYRTSSSQDDSNQDSPKTQNTENVSNANKQFSAVNIKIKPKDNTRKKIDYSQIYTANNFITTVRAFNEFLLRPK